MQTFHDAGSCFVEFRALIKPSLTPFKKNQPDADSMMGWRN